MSEKTDNLETRLGAIGMSGKRARFYLSALELGEASVTDIAQHCGVTRTTAYALFEKLQEEGVVTELRKNGKTRVVAENPDILLHNLEDRRAALSNLLPDLKAIYGGASHGPKFRIYNGVEGVRAVLNTVLLSGSKELCGILSMKELLTFPGEDELQRFIDKRVEAGMSLRVIRATREDTKGIWESSRRERREVRFTKTQAALGMTSFIFEGHVAVISSQRENYALVIESAEYALLQRTLFDALWLASK